MRPRPTCLLLVALLVPGVTDALRAQAGSLRVTVTDSANATPLPGAIVEIRTAAGALLRTLTTDLHGVARARLVDGDTLLVTVRLIGYRPVAVAAGPAAAGEREATVAMARASVVLQPLIVTASRSGEEAPVDVPLATSVVGPRRLGRQLVTTTVEHLADLPETQVVSGGLMTRRYTTRGPNFGTSANVRTMTDFRYTILPGVNHNVDYLTSTTALDVTRIELVRGQGTVVYGPNASRGVLNLITPSPLDDQGTTAQVMGGSRNAVQATLAHAMTLGSRAGLRVSGEYFTGDDWLPPGYASDSTIGGVRLSHSRRFRANARMDWQADARTRATLFGGVAQASVYDPVTFSGFPVLIDDGRVWQFQGRVTRGEAMANVFVTRNDLDRARLTGVSFPFVDRSSMVAVQLQNGAAVGSRTALRFGLDASHTAPVSDSTLYGGFEGRADVTEVGGFASLTSHLTPRFEALLAGRTDYNSIIGNLAFGPWAAVVFRPGPTHAVRFSVTRSFTTGGAADAYADFPVAPVGGLPYHVRNVGDGAGRTFRRDCNGLCMRSPFNDPGLGGPAAYLPADATTQWPAAVALLLQQGVDLSAIPAPTGAQVGSTLGTLDLSRGRFTPTAVSDVRDEGRAQRRWITQVELGYTGMANRRLRVGADLYYRATSFISSAIEVVTPNVFFDEASLSTYLANYLPAAQAAGVAHAMATIPIGTVTPQQANDPTDIELGQYRLRGIHYWGASLEVELALAPEFTARSAYTWMSDDLVTGEHGARVVFNNPRHRVDFGLLYDNARTGLSTGIEGRWLDSYPATNGAATATLPSYTTVNATAGYRIPRLGLALSLTVYNAFNDVHQELPGAARIGRYALAGVRATL